MAGAGTSASEDHLSELAISIRRRFEGLSLPSDCCIFTVPKRLRQTNEEAYTPRVVAIGPYHRHNPSLMLMEDHKLLYLRNFLRHDQNYRLEHYIQRVKSWEYDARNCFDKPINLDSNHFTEMILLDGIFVIQLLLMYRHPQKMLYDQIFGNPWILTDVRRDMTLLENQIPFFIIQRLFEMALGTHQQDMPELLELVCQFFKTVTMVERLLDLAMASEVKHFVHAISLSFLTSVSKDLDKSNRETKFPRAQRSWTEPLFRNMIAFEQCYHQKDKYLIDYMTFMESLVDTPGDAKLLIDEGIIDNWLSNKESAMQIINSFGVGAKVSVDFYFNNLSHELINHCHRPYNKWKATFKRDYCSSPWVVISVIAAVLLLLLTVVQTVCSVISLKNLPF
ncbi:hypothetical protein ACJRO7_014492 [Eucalyptus globulus]|uniref:Uncharacterized protein n=1 Tax=Eucalyptus globulus TaxID=34317 RepID=A0ABD3L1B3_EUCGL